MVSVDRNTLISQIVSLNPQLKPDELRKLSDAQLQAKLSQCIAGNKQDKNVDSVRINNSSSEASETPKMTTEEAQDNAIENIESNAEQAQKLLDAQDDGDISKAYNFVKEKLNSELAKSNVEKVVHKQFETAEFLREAKQGTLTYKEYLRRKREDIFKTFPEIDSYNDKQKQMIKKGLDSLTEGQLNRLQNQLLALPEKDDKNYQNSVNSFKQNFFEESTVEKTTTSRIGEVSKTSKSREIKKAYNPSDGDRLMTFEETYLLEQGVEFNKENIQKFNESTAQYTFANNLHNRLQDIHNMLDNDITLVKGNNANGVDLKTLENGNKRLKTSIYQALSKLYGNDIDKINKGLQDLTGETYEFKQKNTDPKQGLTLDNLELVDSSIPKDSKFKSNTDMVLPSLAEKVLKGLDTNYSKALNGKKLEDYAKTMANDYKNAYGTKDATALASSFAQDQEGIVQTARNTVQIAGMVVMVGGMAFFPPAALGGGLISSFGGIAVEAYNENTKENPNEEKNKELRQETLVNAALFAIGAGSGKVGSMAKTALTAKNAPKLVVAMADIGVDSSLSLLGDLTLTGQIDLSGEGFSQLMSLVAGHKGKIVKGVQKGKQFLKEKFNAQTNTNNKILQMPDGTVVEVKPDGSTVEVKADNAKAVKTEVKTNNTEPKVINIPAGKFEAPNAKFAETDEAFRSIVTKRSNDIRELNKITDIDEFCQKSFELIKKEMGLDDSSIKLQITDKDNYYDHETNTVFISRNWAGKEKGHIKGKGDKAEIFGGMAHELNHYLQWKEIVLNFDSENPNWNNIIGYLQQFEGAQKNIEYIVSKYPDNTELKEAFEKAKSYQDNWLNYVDAFDENGKLKTGTEYDKYKNQPVEAESFNRGDIVVDEYRKTVSKEIKPDIKPTTTLKTKEDFETALDKATTRDDFLAIRNEIFKMPNSPERVELFELYTRKQQDWSTRRINGNDPNQHTDKPNMAVKNMAEDIKTYTQEEVNKLIAQDPEHIKVMTNGKILRITDNFEFVHIGNIAKSNGIKVLDSKAFDKKISNMQNEYNDTHRFTEDDRQKLNELYNNAKTDEEKQFLLQVIDAKIFTGDYLFDTYTIYRLQENYSPESKAVYNAIAGDKDNFTKFTNQDFVDLMALSKNVDKDIIIHLVNAKNAYDSPRFSASQIQNLAKLGQNTDRKTFDNLVDAKSKDGSPKYNYLDLQEKIALESPMAKSLLTKAQDLIKDNAKILEIRDQLVINAIKQSPEAINKQLKMINLLNDNALKEFLANKGLENVGINKQTVDAINSAHPKVLQVILNKQANDPDISVLLKDFENIPAKLLDGMTDKGKIENLLVLAHSKCFGYVDIYNNTKPDKNGKHTTLDRISDNTKLELAQMGHVYTDEAHISSVLDFIETPKYQELKTTLFEKFGSKFDTEEFDSKLQAYLIANKTGNPDEFINYVKSQDFNKLTSIAPRVEEFEPEQLFEFFNYHKSQGTELTPENLTYKGNLTHAFETNMTDYQSLSQILSRFPNTDRRVGHLPKEWINDVPKSEQKDFVANIYQAFSNFASIPKDERNVNNLATTLKSIFNKNVDVEQLGYGNFGTGYKISIEGSKPFVLKAFDEIKKENKYMKNIHGHTIEPQNALYSKGKGNDFADFYFGKVNDVYDKDGFMVNEFLPPKESKSQQRDLTIRRFDSSDVDRASGHNLRYGKIIDYGAMEITDKRLMDNGSVAKLTRIISSNMIASKNSNVYGFNDTRLTIVKDAINKNGNPKDILDAISIIEKYTTKEIDKNSLDELKALKKDAMFKWLDKNRPDIENKEAYFAAHELNGKITQIENSIINAFKDTGLDKGLEFSNRAKSVQSMYDKINSNMKKGKSLDEAIKKVQDGYGVRTILNDFDYTKYPEIVEMYKKDPEQAYRMAAKKQSEHIIEKLEKLIEKQLNNGDFSMVTISNYKGKDGLPYLSTEQINKLCEFAKQKGIILDIKTDETGSMENIKGSGYTALQMNLKYKDGTVIEWQTRGKDVDKFAEAEHVMYDSRQEKDITGGREQLKELYAPYEKAAQGMEKDDFAEYMDYLTQYYKQLRLKELGFPVIFPKLPAKFGTNPDISAEGLLKLHEEKERILKAA